MRIKNWERNDELATEITNQDTKGWYNTQSDEAVVRYQQETGNYIAYYYSRPQRYQYSHSRKTKGAVLFRDSAKNRIDSRIVDCLRNHPEEIDRESICRSELSNPTTLQEWAYYTGAMYMSTEKIGNCKESNGEVAIFEGSPRRGEGAYVALASEIGPRGKTYASIGFQSNGYYRVSTSGFRKPRSNAIELYEPSVSFFADGKIIITNHHNKQIQVIPTEKGQKEKSWRKWE